MKILDVTQKIEENKLKEIALGIKNGKLCLFPTETVYGIGTNGLDEKAVEKIYKAKKRNKKNPVNLLVSDLAMIEKITKDISPLEYKLMEAFFPGPFTIILKRKNIVPNIVTSNSDFVGIRMPNSTIAKKLVELANVPIAAPSANVSGKLSGTKLADIIDEFSDALDFAIDGGESKIGMESTIIRVIDNVPHILRPGFITPEEIKNIAGSVVLDDDKNDILPSSNMQHYGVDSKAILVYHKNNLEMIHAIIDLSKEYSNPMVLCCEENLDYYGSLKAMAFASKDELAEYSKNLFSCLRKASSFSPDAILVEGVKEEGLGIAIMNRLKNVCDEKYIEK